MRRNRFLTAGIFLSLWLVAGRAAWCEGELLLQTGQGSVLSAPVLGTTVEVRVTGIVARARITQIFRNPSQEWLTGIYLFPLPDGAAVDTLRLAVGERVLEGVVQEKGEAKKTFETAAQEGRKASLLDQIRPGLFTTSVANVGPGETVEVRIELQQVVRYQAGRFTLQFPLLAAPRYTPAAQQSASACAPAIPQPPVLPAGAKPNNPFALHVDLAPGFPLTRITRPTHRIAVQKDPKRLRWAVDLAEKLAFADGDFVLEWAPAIGREPRAVYFTEEVDGERYALLMMMPPDEQGAIADRLPRETVFVIDTSGSMAGPSIEQARQALVLGLDRLGPADWFNVVEFDSTASALFPDSVPANPVTIQQARQYVQKMAADGGTEMLPALEIALRGQGRGGLVQQVVFITDGQVGNESDLLRYLPSHLADRRLFTVAIGPAPNTAFLRRAADLGRGSFTHISSLEKVAEGMSGLFTHLEAPMLRQIEVRWADPNTDAAPERVPDLYLGEPLVVAARLGENGPVAVSGLRNGRSWDDELPVAAEVKGAGLDKLWANRKIQALMDSLQEGGDAAEVQRAVTDLGLRHHLMTPYTSLVAVDVEPTAPAGVEAPSRLMPLNAPRGVAPSIDVDASGVEDVITVLGETPLLDARRIAVASTVSQTELESIPGARDPWAVLQATPGVLTDRINVGGNESGQQSVAALAGTAAGQNVLSVDGLVVTDMTALGSGSTYYDFDDFEELEVATGGPDVTLETPGAQIKAVRPRGTNEWRASGLAQWSDGALAGERSTEAGVPGNGLESLQSGEVEAGGPLLRDRFWIWGEASRGEIDTIALGGQEEDRVRQSGNLKLNIQLTPDLSAVLTGSRGTSESSGAGAGPDRSPETTWEEDGRETLWRAEATYILNSNVYLTGAWGGGERRLRDIPRQQGDADEGDADEGDADEGDAWIDPAGVAHGSWFRTADEQRTDEARLTSSSFFNTGSASHEVVLGAGWRRQDETRALAAPGRLGIAGEALGLTDLALAELWRGGPAGVRTGTTSLWTQDTLSIGRGMAILGARLDRQDLGIPGGSGSWTLAPRLGWTHAPGSERETLLRASLGRFASRLGSRAAWHLDPGAPAVLRSLFTDLDGDMLPDPGEPLRLWSGEGVDPLRPGIDPDAVDPGLRPEITDEALLGIEHALRPDFVIGLRASWRRTRDLLEERLLVREEADGEAFAATAGAWLPAGRLTGVLPDGAPYDVPFYDLRPGLLWTGGTLLVNGDRQRDELGLTFHWQKRLSYRWMTRGHLTWQDGEQRLGSAFRRFDDPTNTLGSGDDEGLPVAEAGSGRPHEDPRFLSGRWAFHANGLVQLPWDLRLSAALNAREGDPLPYYRRIARERVGIAAVQLTDHADTLRGDDLVTLDTRLDRSFLTRDTEITLSLEAFNLAGASTVRQRELDLGVGRGGFADEVIAPRTFRLGLRVEWR